MLNNYKFKWVVLKYLCIQIDQQQRFVISHYASVGGNTDKPSK